MADKRINGQVRYGLTGDITMIGKTISHYHILEELGRGGMGVVYKATDTKLKRTVALKFLPHHLTKNDTDLTRFLQEAQAAAALNHPNVCTIHEIHDEGEHPFIVMEYVEGRTLRDVIHTPLGPPEVSGQAPSRGEKVVSPPLKGDLGGCKELSLNDLIDIPIQIAEALKAAHAKGIIHRDIKSENIMVTDDGRVKVMDFGLAKLRGSVKLTKTGTTTGTAAYMSPEQFKNEEVDHRTDIWSLGVVLYEILTGSLPFQGDYEQAMMYSILNEEPEDVKKMYPDCTDVLADVVSTCLQKEPENRFASMQDILDVLEGTVQPVKVGVVSAKHNLPVQLTSFIGRSQQIEIVKKLLSENRLVTLTGAGGCGKTRLAVEIAVTLKQAYEDGIWFINLAPGKDPNFVAKEITKVLDVKEEPNKAIIDNLIENIKNKTLLILLDNCEHLVQTCAEIADRLLRSVEGIQILATSREPLNTLGEVPWRVPSLSIPDNGSKKDIDEVLRYEAIKLFTDRACSSKPGFNLNPQNISSIVQVCQRVDGIPLAIELAASRIRHLSPETILERLSAQMMILASSNRAAPERQQTLQATIDWSYNLLTEEEKRLFNQLSVFTGDFNIEAVEEICTDDELKKENILPLLCQLVDKSLVIAEDQEDESVRYRCLVSLQQYSLQKLKESGEEEKYRKVHLLYYLQMAEQAYEEQFESELTWMNKLESEHDNLVAGLNWSFTQSIEEFILLAGYLAWFWRNHSHIRLAEDYLGKAVSKDIEKSGAYARALCGLGMIQWSIGGNFDKTKKLMNESLGIWRQHKNLREEVIVLSWLSSVSPAAGDFEAGLKGSIKSLEIARKLGSPGLINFCLLSVCQATVHSEQFDRGRPLAEELLISSEKLEYVYGIEVARHYLGDCALGIGDFKEAEKRYGLGIETALKYGFTWLAACDLQGVAFALSGQSRWVKSIRVDSAAREKLRVMGSTTSGAAQFWDEWIETYLEGARKKVGEELTRKYEEEGNNMGFEAAVEYALDFDKD